LLSAIEQRFPNDGSGPVRLGDVDETTLELLLPMEPRFYPPDSDEQILDVSDQIRKFTGKSTIVTADTGMLLRARTAGFEVFKVPNEYLRKNQLSETTIPQD